MMKKSILKDAGVLLIVLVMVLATAVIVTGSSIKNTNGVKDSDAGHNEISSIEGTEIFRQLFERYSMTCIPAFGYCKVGDSLRACISADGGISWYRLGSGTEDTNIVGSTNNGFILSEGFEGGIMPPTGWSITGLSITGSGTDAWAITNSAHSGNYAAEYISTGDDMETRLLSSPMLDCSSVSSPILEFWYCITDADPYNLAVSIYSNGTGETLDLDFEETGIYTHATIDLTGWASSEVSIQFWIDSYYKSTVRLDDIVLYDGGKFQGDVDPIGENTEITEISDGYVISGGDEYGALFSPTPTYNDVTCTIDLNDIAPGGETKIKYFSLAKVLMYEVTIGHETETFSKFSEGVHPVDFNGTASGAPSIIAWDFGDGHGDPNIKVLEAEIIDGYCGAFAIADFAFGVHPVDFNGTASGAPSIIAWDFGDGGENGDNGAGEFKWIFKGETYYVDYIEIIHPNNNYPIGIGEFAVTAKVPIELSSTTMNTSQFTVSHIRASDPPNTPNIDGPTSGKAGEKQTYTISTIEPNGDSVCYFIQWGDNSGGWTRLYGSNDITTVEHTWSAKGDYTIKVKVKDIYGFESDWETLTVSMPKCKSNIPFGFIFVFGFDVDVKIVQLEPGEDYVDLEVLSKPFYIWENEIQTRNPGEFIRLNNAKGLFSPSLPFCFGICDDWGIIG